jgi:hypothetical protein
VNPRDTMMGFYFTNILKDRAGRLRQFFCLGTPSTCSRPRPPAHLADDDAVRPQPHGRADQTGQIRGSRKAAAAARATPTKAAPCERLRRKRHPVLAPGQLLRKPEILAVSITVSAAAVSHLRTRHQRTDKAFRILVAYQVVQVDLIVGDLGAVHK